MPEYGKTLYLAIVEDISEKMKPFSTGALVALSIILFLLMLASLILFMIFFPIGCIVFVITLYIFYATLFTIYNKRKNEDEIE